MLRIILNLYRMDVERTIEFILQQQARTEQQQARTEEAVRRYQANAENEMAAIRKQQAKAEVQMAAIRKLIQTGMRMIVKNEALIKEVAAAQKDLAKTQKVTETKLQGLIDAWRRSGNGNHRKN